MKTCSQYGKVLLIAGAMLLATPCKAAEIPSPYWVHGAVVIHSLSASLDMASSWRQPENNQFYSEKSGPWRGCFYRTGAARMAGITLGIAAISEVLGAIKPALRKYITAFNLCMAGTHIGATAWNAWSNPYYR